MHEPSSNWTKDHAASIKRVLGLWFVTLYSIIYAGFVVINVVSPSFMAVDVGSFNVAIVYGFLLIIFAIFLAAIYNHICTHAEEVMTTLRSGDETESLKEGHS
ncbi:MAG: DUF485 domain-containing protein [bacterium]|nr:DUF485 domain-containing protein [bacterium]